MKEWKKNLVLSLLSVTVSLLVGEMVLRVFGNSKTEIDDPILATRTVGRPGWDSRGWKNHEPLVRADIVAIGDSQTEGNNADVDDSWPQTLGRLASTSVYQMAMGGYGPVQYAALFDDAVKLHPKVVIVGFYFGNDLQDAYRVSYGLDHWKELRDPSFISQPAQKATSSDVDYRTVLSTGLDPHSFSYKVYELRLWVRAHSVLYASAGNATRILREKVGLAKSTAEKLDDVAVYAQSHPDMVYAENTPGINTVMSPSYRHEAIMLDYPTSKEGWRITQDRFREIKKKAQQNGVRLVFIVIPTKEGVYLEHWRHKEGKIPPAFDAYDRHESELATVTKVFCEQEKLECVFALPAMSRGVDNGERVYGVTMDGHPVAGGYKLIAETLADYLAKKHE